MARTTEDTALKLLKAIQKEWSREPDFHKCKTIAALSSSGLCKSQEELDRVLKFIVPMGLIEAVGRSDGKAAKLTKAGEAWIASRKPEKWNPQARVALLALILAIGTAAAAIIVKWLEKSE